jgi:hypothetical protein
MTSIQVDLSAGPSPNELPIEQIEVTQNNEIDDMDDTNILDDIISIGEPVDHDEIDNIDFSDRASNNSGDLVLDIPIDDPAVLEDSEPDSENEVIDAAKNDDQPSCSNCQCKPTRPAFKRQFKRQTEYRQQAGRFLDRLSDNQNWRTVGPRQRSENNFNDKRNKWLSQEKLPAHKRFPAPHSPLDINVRANILQQNFQKELAGHIRKADVLGIRQVLNVIVRRKQVLPGNLVRKLSNCIIMATYKGRMPLRFSNPLPLWVFPRYLRASVAAVALCDPVELLKYLNYPSLGYKLNASFSGETLWRRVPPSIRVKCYRDAFEAGAALVRRMN